MHISNAAQSGSFFWMNIRGKELLLAIGAIAISLQAASAEIRVAPNFPVETVAGQNSASALVESYRKDVQAKPVSKTAKPQQQSVAKS